MDVGTPAEQSPGTRDCLAGVARRAVIHRAAVRILAFGMPIVAVAAALLIPIPSGLSLAPRSCAGCMSQGCTKFRSASPGHGRSGAWRAVFLDLGTACSNRLQKLDAIADGLADFMEHLGGDQPGFADDIDDLRRSVGIEKEMVDKGAPRARE